MRQIVGAAAAALLLGVGGAAAQQQPAELRYTTGAPDKTPWVTQLRRFENDVAEESKGALKIASFIAAQLGNEQDTMQQVARGRIDMGGFSNGAVALVAPELALLGLPFYFRTTAEQDCVLDNHMTNPVYDLLGKKNVKFLGWTEVGTADLVGKRPFLLPSEVKGLKAAAASNKVSAITWSTLGANPTPIGITEIASAFQTGLVDVQGTVVTFYLPSGLAKVAPVLSRVELSDAPGIVLMNKASYDKLSAENKASLDRAMARRTAGQLRQEIRGFEETLRGMHVKAGGQVVQLTPAQRDEWRKALQPAWPTMVKEIGGNAAAFFKTMEAGRTACEKKA
jgi:TRAP-type C4-dicarboxylate transport system substrate-binding protein